MREKTRKNLYVILFYYSVIFYLPFFILFYFNQCTNRVDNNSSKTDDCQLLTEIDNSFQISKDTIGISLLADTLMYVHLQNNNKKIDFNNAVIDDSLLFVNDYLSHSLLLFNIKGRFIRKINSELHACRGFDILTDHDIIFVSTTKGMIVQYDYDGNIIRKIPAPVEGIGNYFAAIDTNKFAISVWNFGYNSNRLLIIDSKGDIIKKFPNPEMFNSNNVSMTNASRFHRSLYRHNNSIRYHPFYSDTLFVLSDTILEPIFVEKKVKKVPFEHRNEYLRNENEFIQHCIQDTTYATRFFESTHFVIINYRVAFLNYPADNYLLFDKKKRTLFKNEQRFSPQKGEKLHLGIFNDYDGGLPFNITAISNDYLICNYNTSNRFKRD